MNLYIFQWQYEDGWVYHICADNIDSALDYFLTTQQIKEFEPLEEADDYYGAPDDVYHYWILPFQAHDGLLTLLITEKPFHEGVL